MSKMGRQPGVSDEVKKSRGEMAWKMTQRIIVRLIAWSEVWKWAVRRGRRGR